MCSLSRRVPKIIGVGGQVVSFPTTRLANASTLALSETRELDCCVALLWSFVRHPARWRGGPEIRAEAHLAPQTRPRYRCVLVLFVSVFISVACNPDAIRSAFPRWCTDAAPERRESAQQSSLIFTEKVGKRFVSCREPCETLLQSSCYAIRSQSTTRLA